MGALLATRRGDIAHHPPFDSSRQPQKKPLLGLTEPLDSPDNPDCQIYQSAAAERTFERDLEGNRPRFQPLSLGVHGLMIR